MPSLALAFATAFLLVFLAELGDKSQLLLVAQAALHRPLRVLVEALLAFALLTLLAVSTGALLSHYVDASWLSLAGGLLFLVFAALAARDATRTEEPAEAEAVRGGSTFVLVAVSEMGDKTQLATAALVASSGHALATGSGAWSALAMSSVLAVLAGGWLATKVDERRRAAWSAVLFFGLGCAGLLLGVLGLVR